MMNPLDAVWLMMESADTPMHVGVLAIFKKPRKAPNDYLATLTERFREVQPVAPWNQQLSAADLLTPAVRLTDVRNLDLDYHFRHSALPSPGGERQLGVMVSLLHSKALDRSRPLWEFHLIEGLQHDRFAFYIKLHHALVGNVNGIPMLMSLLAGSARRRNMPPPWSLPLPGREQDRLGVLQSLEIPTSLSSAIDSMSSLGKAAGGFLLSAFNRKDGGSFLLPAGTPVSTLNRPINTQRRIATQQLEQQRIKRLAQATGSTENEILTYLCGSCLRRFFKEYNALPDESLVAAVPISLQERSERLPGNAIAGIRVSLGTHIGDPLARLEYVKASIKNVRKDRASLPEAAVTAYVMLRAAPVYASQTPVLGRFVPPLANLVVSNTPGPYKPMYFDGARMESIYPISQLMQYSALSIDCVNYAGTLNIGFTGARDTLPHLQRMAVYLGKAVSDLEELIDSAEDAA